MNAHKGEVALGDHTLVLSVNAICELEEKLGKGIDKIGEELGEGVRMRTLRAVVWAGLLEKQPDTKETDAGRIIGEVGIEAAVQAVGNAFAAAFPQGEASGKARPRKGAA